MKPLALAALLAAPAAAQPIPPDVAARIDTAIAAWAAANHVPGLTWGIVRRGQGLVHQGHAGVADVATGRKVTPGTAFRIASMTKAFTALTVHELAAEGRFRRDDKVSTLLPETAGWAGTITVTDLLHHMAGFVTDDPWGDRQTPLPEARFTALLRGGVPFTRAPGLTHEYSNLGYAMLGRIISTAAGQPFEAEIARRRFAPLGMAATTFNLADVPAAGMATGWRWEDGKWLREPDMPPGAFGAMGGIITTAPDYAHWLDHLLSAWPAAPPGAAEPAAKANIRALLRGEGSPRRLRRPGSSAGTPECTLAVVYGGGLRVGDDCTLGRVAFHGGGYPGYGSHMIIAPERGWGIFIFTNRTYAGPAAPAWDALLALHAAGLMPADAVPVSPALAGLVEPLHALMRGGRIAAARALIAENLLMDRDAAHRDADLAALKARAGRCDHKPAVQPRGALEGDYVWPCQNGTLIAHTLLAPTPAPQIQALDWELTAH